MKWLSYLALILFALSRVSADVSEFRASDPRLEKKVTLRVNHVKLEDVAKSLSEQSSVDIKAGTGKRDWKARERKVTIHAKDIPLGQMLDEIKRLTSFHLSREGKEGAWNYVIWQDMKGRQLEEEMVIAAKEAAAQRARDIRQGMLDTAEEALKMTPEEALKNKDKEPLTAFMGGTKSGRGFAQILSSLQSSFPTEYELMMRGKKVTIPVSSFSPGMGGAAADIMTGGLPAWIAKSAGMQAGTQFVPYELAIEAMKGPDSNIQEMLGLYGVIFLNARAAGEQTGNGFPAGIFPMSSPDSKISNLFGKFLLAMEEGVDPNEASKQINAEAKNDLAGLLARKSPTEENPPTDPKLLREIEIKEVTGTIQPGMQSSNLPEEQGKMAAEIARAAEISVLLESYSTMIPFSTFIKKGKQPFYNILVAAEKAGCTWELGDGTLRIRPEDWAIQRSREIPESFLQYYKALLEKNSWLSLDDIAAIAIGLTDEQIEGGLNNDPDLGYILTAVIADKGRRDFLRAYGLMNPSQKSQLALEGGLPFAQLNDQQWAYLEEIITDRLGGVNIIDGLIRIVPREDATKRPDTEIFELMVQTPNGEPRSVKTWINVPTKAYIKQMQDQRKKIQEAMEEAAAEKAAAEKAAKDK